MLSSLSNIELIVIVPCILLLYFLPSIVAFLLNRNHKMKILAANVPAGISWVMWFAVMAWAITGKPRQTTA
ncbi:superinfection immunity protein [uncultured Ferrimonas sp.]|uniref:superinfection immunity protein n=1 Tax=uncultured Ferrimonas sp. TaxID=432640 RepID=UPI00260EDC13|nr:superinfection immunity protein [uncultured Ferrimonas sp.]